MNSDKGSCGSFPEIPPRCVPVTVEVAFANSKMAETKTTTATEQPIISPPFPPNCFRRLLTGLVLRDVVVAVFACDKGRSFSVSGRRSCCCRALRCCMMTLNVAVDYRHVTHSRQLLPRNQMWQERSVVSTEIAAVATSNEVLFKLVHSSSCCSGFPPIYATDTRPATGCELYMSPCRSRSDVGTLHALRQAVLPILATKNSTRTFLGFALLCSALHMR